MVFTADGKAELVSIMSTFKTPFNVIVGSTLTIGAGTPIPTGRLDAVLSHQGPRRALDMVALLGSMRRLVWWSLLSACSAGPGDGGGGGGGGGSDAGQDGAIDARQGPVWIDAPLGDGGNNDCKPRVTSYGNGQHNTGRDCMDSCHNHGFTLAGTLYTSPTSNTGYAGATITIQGANNATIDVVVQANGNFWTSQPIAFPGDRDGELVPVRGEDERADRERPLQHGRVSRPAERRRRPDPPAVTRACCAG